MGGETFQGICKHEFGLTYDHKIDKIFCTQCGFVYKDSVIKCSEAELKAEVERLRALIQSVHERLFSLDAIADAGAPTSDLARRCVNWAKKQQDKAERYEKALRAIAEGCSFPSDDVQRAVRDRAREALATASASGPQRSTEET